MTGKKSKSESEAVITNHVDEQTELLFDYDELWKDFIAEFWREILEKFIPDLYAKADLNHEPEFLDKELHEITSALEPEGSTSHKRYVDELIKIFLQDGSDEWVLLHIEIQGKDGENISLRMFRYYCLIFIRYSKNPAALAILTAKRPKREGEPGIYKSEVFGTSIEYKYNLVKAYALSDEELTSGNNVVDLFIYSTKIAAKYRKSRKKKLGYMKTILQLLHDKGFTNRQSMMFIMFLERVMRLGEEKYVLEFDNEVKKIFHEGDERMRRKTVTETIYESGIAEGRTQGFNQGINQGITQGITQGISQGINESRRETSFNLIKLGLLSDEQIAGVTNQTLEDIKNLRIELNSTK
ncbi:MAG: hypothetical protein IJP48_03050 [Synergistaceae bacterium]|nr:hypothetical protein [Synergistaceae bacterium]